MWIQVNLDIGTYNTGNDAGDITEIDNLEYFCRYHVLSRLYGRDKCLLCLSVFVPWSIWTSSNSINKLMAKAFHESFEPSFSIVGSQNTWLSRCEDDLILRRKTWGWSHMGFA